jgi:hypothetical protein
VPPGRACVGAAIPEAEGQHDHAVTPPAPGVTVSQAATSQLLLSVDIGDDHSAWLPITPKVV